MSEKESSHISDEQLMDDLEETNSSGYFDVYMRFNDDIEKDYCFQIKTSTQFKDMFKVFDALPIALRPNVFYHGKPIGFRVSTAPGYLTEDGNFLFNYDAEKQYKNIKDLNDTVATHVWPGQLLLPVWEFNSFGWYSFLSFLLVWLYTDLPDFISPTPGICLTNQVSKLLSAIATYYGQGDTAQSLLDDISSPVPVTGQLVFFAFHVIKVLALVGVLWSGLFNPIKLFRFGSKNIKLEVTKEELVELGWTGTRKATPDEYKDHYREYKIKEYGGMIQAHRAGLFDVMKNLGSELGPGEGYNTPTGHKGTFKELLEKANSEDDDLTFKLELNYEYFFQLGRVFSEFIDDKEGSELTEYIKQYRRYGLLYSDDNIKKIVQKRKLANVANKLG
ncbi:glucose signaling factor 2 [Scheffersomyces xylosifermentans]|uniref:glucose signaling factor 2 n=1 Tax=Scheffersomyces xylosifermentans TaxID=1304137 RepID=UPI00315C64D7